MITFLKNIKDLLTFKRLYKNLRFSPYFEIRNFLLWHKVTGLIKQKMKKTGFVVLLNCSG